jgi:hypothetical protein
MMRIDGELNNSRGLLPTQMPGDSPNLPLPISRFIHLGSLDLRIIGAWAPPTSLKLGARRGGIAWDLSNRSELNERPHSMSDVQK